MKIQVILALCCASVCGADISSTNVVGDITTKISVASGVNGKPDVRIENVYRAGTKIMQVLSYRNGQGDFVVKSRAYCVDGKLHSVESDEDGDGFFESFSVFDPKTHHFEMFTRFRDGSVRPISSDVSGGVKMG